MTKKYPLIHLNNQVYMIDKEAKCPKDSWAIFPNTRNSEITGYNPPIQCKWDYAANGVHNLLVIASTDKSLKLPLLPAIETNSWIEMDDIAGKLLIKHLNDNPGTVLNTISLSVLRELIVLGYKAASSKKWTDEDMRKAYNKGTNIGAWYYSADAEEREEYDKNYPDNKFGAFIKSLNPLPTHVEVEMTCGVKRGSCDCSEMDMDCQFLVPKVDENNIVNVIRWIWNE